VVPAPGGKSAGMTLQGFMKSSTKKEYTMAQADVSITALISQTTKELLDQHTRMTGVKKAHVVEIALLNYLRALQEIPAEFIIPPRIVVSQREGNALLKKIKNPPKPTKAMKEVMGSV
jgi:hypothetical protein